MLGAYLKRGANLMFLAQKHRYVPSAELRYALEESISSLELAGVECAMEVTQGVRLPAEAAAACYSRFESVVEGALGQLDALFVRAIWKDHRLNLYLSVETGADLKAVCPAAVQEAPGSHPADPLGHASHSLTIPPKSCSPRISCQSLSPEAAGPHAAASPRRVPQALRGFFCWRHGPFRQKKTGLLHISVGQSCLAARVGARASGVSGRVRLSARFSFLPESPGCFPGSARASARC